MKANAQIEAHQKAIQRTYEDTQQLKFQSEQVKAGIEHVEGLLKKEPEKFAEQVQNWTVSIEEKMNEVDRKVSMNIGEASKKEGEVDAKFQFCASSSLEFKY